MLYSAVVRQIVKTETLHDDFVHLSVRLFVRSSVAVFFLMQLGAHLLLMHFAVRVLPCNGIFPPRGRWKTPPPVKFIVTAGADSWRS